MTFVILVVEKMNTVSPKSNLYDWPSYEVSEGWTSQWVDHMPMSENCEELAEASCWRSSAQLQQDSETFFKDRNKALGCSVIQCNICSCA
jgi:hypothetical protein